MQSLKIRKKLTEMTQVANGTNPKTGKKATKSEVIAARKWIADYEKKR